MQKSNANPKCSSDNPVWYFLAEYSLSEYLSDQDQSDERTVGVLFQVGRELGIPPECVENIEWMLVGFAKEARASFRQEGLELRGHIRVFCQKKIIDDANSTRATARPYDAEQAAERAQLIHPSGAKMIGGWGYFLIERRGNLSASSSASSGDSIDLYLYKEGE